MLTIWLNIRSSRQQHHQQHLNLSLVLDHNVKQLKATLPLFSKISYPTTQHMRNHRSSTSIHLGSLGYLGLQILFIVDINRECSPEEISVRLRQASRVTPFLSSFFACTLLSRLLVNISIGRNPASLDLGSDKVSPAAFRLESLVDSCIDCAYIVLQTRSKLKSFRNKRLSSAWEDIAAYTI